MRLTYRRILPSLLAAFALTLPAPLTAALGLQDTIGSIRATRQPKPASGRRASGRKPARRPRPAMRRGSGAKRSAGAARRQAPPPAATVLVSRMGGGEYRTIGEAVKGVKPGTRILVRAGVYSESVTIDKSVQIAPETAQDQGGVIVEGAGGPCLTVRAEQVGVTRLTLRGGADYCVEVRSGLLILRDCDVSSGRKACLAARGATAAANLLHCKVDGGGDGIVAADGATIRCDNSEVFLTGGNGIVATASTLTVTGGTVRNAKGIGIVVEGKCTAALLECTVRANSGGGVEVRRGASATIRSCRLGEPKGASPDPGPWGLHACDDGQAVVEETRVSGHARGGVRIERGGGLTMRGSDIYDNAGIGVTVVDRGKALMEVCQVFGNTGGGIEMGKDAAPTIRGCKVHDNRDDQPGSGFGIRAIDGAQGIVENTEVLRNGFVGIAVGGNANPTFRNCDASGHLCHGVWVIGATGRFEKLQSYANADCGLLVQSEGSQTTSLGSRPSAREPRLGDPVFEDCSFHDNKGKGIAIEFGGKGSYQNCNVFANPVGIYVSTASAPTIRRCHVFNGTQPGLNYGGVVFWKGSTGLVEDCEIYGMPQDSYGIGIYEGSTPVIRRCEVHHNRSFGIPVNTDAAPTIEECIIHDIAGCGINVSGHQGRPSNPTIAATSVRSCRVGIVVNERGLGRFVKCSVTSSLEDGVLVQTHANPSFRSCVIEGSKRAGVWVDGTSKARFEDCDFLDNTIARPKVDRGGEAQYVNCRLR